MVGLIMIRRPTWRRLKAWRTNARGISPLEPQQNRFTCLKSVLPQWSKWTVSDTLACISCRTFTLLKEAHQHLHQFKCLRAPSAVSIKTPATQYHSVSCTQQYTVLLQIQNWDQNSETISFYFIDSLWYSAVLNLPWLKKHNPRTNPATAIGRHQLRV